jgi:predicted kinase
MSILSPRKMTDVELRQDVIRKCLQRLAGDRNKQPGLLKHKATDIT